MRRPGVALGVLASALSLFAACSYSPKIDSGALQCSPKSECPRGFSCSASNFCCADGDIVCNGSSSGTGGATGSGTGGATGRTAADFIGTWTFNAGATVFTQCEDNKSGTQSLTGSTLVMAASAAGANYLIADWDQWVDCLDYIATTYDNAGAHLVNTDWFCDDSTDATVEHSWYVTSFEVVPTAAKVATHQASYFRQDTYPATATTINCQQTVTATMTKK